MPFKITFPKQNDGANSVTSISWLDDEKLAEEAATRLVNPNAMALIVLAITKDQALAFGVESGTEVVS